MTHRTGILDLPAELILLILPQLDVIDFLNLTSTCKALHSPDILHEPSYWSNLVRTTFRAPNQPVIAHDGLRWQRLYKRMLTQSRVYLWGHNDKGCLPINFTSAQDSQVLWMRPFGHPQVNASRSMWVARPEKMRDTDDLGVISDLQCGGWSTTLLTAKGALYLAGVIDGTRRQQPTNGIVPLLYPPGFARPNDHYDSTTAIRQLSTGRSHILALSDSGRVWSWSDASRTALNVKFLHHDLVEHSRNRSRDVVEKVFAGWDKSAALIRGTGIVVWEPLRRDLDDTAFSDAALVMQSEVVPHTSHSIRNDRTLHTNVSVESAPANIGEVCNFVVLERLVLFNTHLGKVYASQLDWNSDDQRLGVPVELIIPGELNGEPSFVTDVQGSFRSFAIFTQAGAVLTCREDLAIEYLENRIGDRPLFTLIPALQQKDVIQIAFGDYHFHALHAPGYITSYGKEPQQCGAFGLGNLGSAGKLRGMRGAGRVDAQLVPHAYTEGRRVWFQREKMAWIEYLHAGADDAQESQERRELVLSGENNRWSGEISEWIEQQGRDWESKFGLQDADEDGLGAHFALSVTAAGWHSGALVLVNEDLEDKIRRACEVPDTGVAPASHRHQATSSESTKIKMASPSTTMKGQTSGSLGRPETNEEESEASGSSIVDSALSVAADYGRRFLGLRPLGTINAQPRFISTDRAGSPRPGMQYIWTKEHFPRLVLSDGTEMPGTVPFDDWRYPRPDWKLDITL